MKSARCWLLILFVLPNLSAAPDRRFRFENTVAPVRAQGQALEAGTITRQELTAAELAATQQVNFALRLRNFDELRERIEGGEILSLAEMQDRYFPRPETWQKVARWAATQGLEVAPADISHLTVATTSPVSTVQDALQIRFAQVRGFGGEEYTSAVNAPTIPGEFQDDIAGVLHLQPHLALQPSQVAPPQLGNGWIAPQVFAKLYKADNLGVDGRGQTIAVMGAYRLEPGDLTTFWQTCGLPTTLAQFRQVDLSQNPSPADTTRASEETMDVQWASAMAPGANIVLLTNISIDLVSAWIIAERAAGRPVNQLTSSYALPESTYTVPAAIRETNNQYYASLAAIGVSVFIASGDDGSTHTVVNGVQTKRGYDSTGVTSPFYPASSPFVTGTGGTTVSFRLSNSIAEFPVQEGAWSLSNSPNQNAKFATGGGVSRYFSRPSWQNAPGLPAETMRCVPDVAALAASDQSPFMYFRGLRVPAGGTSLSAPIWAGLCALINQARAEENLPPLGLLGPKIYPLAGTPAFNAMSTGSQSGGDGFSPTATNGAYSVGPHYSLLTGLGSPNMEYLIAALTVIDATPPTPTPNPTPTPPAPSTGGGSGGGSGGGGGAPSGWFFGALCLLVALRKITRENLLAG